MQLDFVEMLRVRDEKRRMRHVEALRRQKELEEGEAKSCKKEGGKKSSMGCSEQLQDLDADQDSVFSSAKATSKPHSSPKPDSHSPPISTRSIANDSTLSRHVRQCHLLPFSRLIEIFGEKCGHFLLPDAGCDRLQPSTQHRISVDGSLMD